MEYFSKKNIILLPAVLLLCSQNVMASDDDYMKMLEGEAATTSVDSSGQREIDSITVDAATAAKIAKKKWVGECDYINETVPANLIRGEFSSYLKQCATGTHVFYRRLELKSKNLIYENYKKLASVKLFVLRENIISSFQ